MKRVCKMGLDISSPSSTKWDYQISLNDHHLSDEEYESLMDSHDELGSAAHAKLTAISNDIQASSETKTPSTKLHHSTDLYSVLRDHHQQDEVLQKLWDELYSVPDWVDWEQIERGQKFFARYALANITGLLFQGFVHGNSVRNLDILRFYHEAHGICSHPMLSRFSLALEVSR